MRIYCDMDDILCETAATLAYLAAERFGVNVAYDEIVDFDLQKSFGLTDDEIRRFMALAHTEEQLRAYPETDGAAKGLKVLASAGHAVEIVTGRPVTSHRATEAWLAAAGLGDFPVTYVNKYGRLFSRDGDAPEMVPMAELLARRYDVVIEDSPLVLPTLAAAWPTTRFLVFDRPWNARCELAANETRVGGWSAILRELGVVE